MLVKTFDIVVGYRVILDQLFQQTCDEIENRLFGLLFVIAVDVHYRNIAILEERLEMIYDYRPSMNR